MALNPTAQGYYYTVKAYEFINDTLGGGTATVDAPSVDADGWAAINSIQKNVNFKNKVKYEIQVYKSANANLGSTLPNGILGDDNGLEIIVWNSYRESVASFAEISGVKQTNFVSGKGNTRFWFEVEASGPGTINPKIQVILKYNTPVNQTALTDMDVAPTGTIPVINFTKAATPPSIPIGFKDLVGSADRIRWNSCDKKWVGLIADLKPNPSKNNKLQYSISVATCDRNGTNLATRFLGWDNITDGPFFGQAQEELLKAIRSQCSGSGNAPPAVVEEGVPPAQDSIRYNPPSHFVTRGVPHGSRTTLKDEDAMLFNSRGKRIEGVRSFYTDINQTAFNLSRNRLGKIYQDDDGAKALNKPGGGPKGKGKINYWGFKFIYNPNSISYGTTTNTSIDWMLNSKDPANLLGGNTTVKVELYLNRIADMTELKSWKGGSYSKNYPTPLTADDVQGILNRGTEYDLEFLYRVLNGDPGRTALLSYSGGQTADFGYITGTPCWFHLHDNMRYYGSMSSVSVNHMIFTESMVPVMSVVTLDFIRYPSLEFSPKDVRDKFVSNANQVVSGSTGATTP